MAETNTFNIGSNVLLFIEGEEYTGIVARVLYDLQPGAVHYIVSVPDLGEDCFEMRESWQLHHVPQKKTVRDVFEDINKNGVLNDMDEVLQEIVDCSTEDRKVFPIVILAVADKETNTVTYFNWEDPRGNAFVQNELREDINEIMNGLGIVEGDLDTDLNGEELFPEESGNCADYPNCHCGDLDRAQNEASGQDALAQLIEAIRKGRPHTAQAEGTGI